VLKGLWEDFEAALLISIEETSVSEQRGRDGGLSRVAIDHDDDDGGDDDD
jgi:hypothetical protein